MTRPRHQPDINDDVAALESRVDRLELAHQIAEARCRVRNSLNISGVGSTWVAIASAWDTETYDPSGMHDPASPAAINIIQAGLYSVRFQAVFDQNGTGARGGRIWQSVSGVNTLIGESEAPASASSFTQFIVDGGHVEAAIGDFFFVEASQGSGGVLAMLPRGTVTPGCWFEAVRAA